MPASLELVRNFRRAQGREERGVQKTIRLIACTKRAQNKE